MFWSSRKTAELSSYREENVYIHPTSEIGSGVELGPFTYIGPHCRVGDGTRLHNNVTIAGHAIVGEHNEIFPNAVIGAEPQDKKYAGEETWVIIGDYNSIRECVTVHGGTEAGGGITRVGNHNLIMAGCHVAHDCTLENHVTMANNVLLGGHVHVEDRASFGGLAAVHHFVTVGAYAFVGGLARVTQDVPPYMLVEGNPIRVWSINRVGLKRNEFSVKDMKALKDAHRLLFRTPVARREAMRRILKAHPDCDKVKHLTDFLRNTERGNQGRARQP